MWKLSIGYLVLGFIILSLFEYANFQHKKIYRFGWIYFIFVITVKVGSGYGQGPIFHQAITQEPPTTPTPPQLPPNFHPHPKTQYQVGNKSLSEPMLIDISNNLI